MAGDAERVIKRYRFPPQIETRMRARRGLDDESWALVERGLREWFICCAWRAAAVIGMPSRLVDEAWHEFILDTEAYAKFCERALGLFLDHRPGDKMDVPIGDALAETVYAWDLSPAGQKGQESVLWDLDETVGIEDPLRLSGLVLAQVRAFPREVPKGYIPWFEGQAM